MKSSRPLMHGHIVALTFLVALFLFPASETNAQTRDLRAERVVLDDNNGNTIAVQTPVAPNVPMSGSYTLTIPEPSTASTTFLLTDPPLGTTVQSISGSLSVGQEITANTIVASSVDGPESGSLRLSSDGSVVVGIDNDNSGTGSSFAIESNALATPDLLRVTETGLTSITSSSATGGLRVSNTNGSGTTNILELQDGTATAFQVQRNGNGTLQGDLTVNGTGESQFAGSVSVGTFLVLDQEEQLTLNAGTTLTPATSHVLIAGNGAGITLSATTAIANGSTTGQMLLLLGASNLNSVTINDGANVQLQGGANRTLGFNDVLTLIWSGTDWIETAYSDN